MRQLVTLPIPPAQLKPRSLPAEDMLKRGFSRPSVRKRENTLLRVSHYLHVLSQMQPVSDRQIHELHYKPGTWSSFEQHLRAFICAWYQVAARHLLLGKQTSRLAAAYTPLKSRSSQTLGSTIGDGSTNVSTEVLTLII